MDQVLAHGSGPRSWTRSLPLDQVLGREPGPSSWTRS